MSSICALTCIYHTQKQGFFHSFCCYNTKEHSVVNHRLTELPPTKEFSSLSVYIPVLSQSISLHDVMQSSLSSNNQQVECQAGEGKFAE